jgi:hypothetical protein
MIKFASNDMANVLHSMLSVGASSGEHKIRHDSAVQPDLLRKELSEDIIGTISKY